MVPLCLNAIMYIVDTIFIYSEDTSKSDLDKESPAKNSLLDLFSLTSDLTESDFETSMQSEI